jgi:hypothetical protein
MSGVFTTIHEFGHQYFQGLLASDESRQPWLDEGLNTFANMPSCSCRLARRGHLDRPHRQPGVRVDDFAAVDGVDGDLSPRPRRRPARGLPRRHRHLRRRRLPQDRRDAADPAQPRRQDPLRPRLQGLHHSPGASATRPATTSSPPWSASSATARSSSTARASATSPSSSTCALLRPGPAHRRRRRLHPRHVQPPPRRRGRLPPRRARRARSSPTASPSPATPASATCPTRTSRPSSSSPPRRVQGPRRDRARVRRRHPRAQHLGRPGALPPALLPRPPHPRRPPRPRPQAAARGPPPRQPPRRPRGRRPTASATRRRPRRVARARHPRRARPVTRRPRRLRRTLAAPWLILGLGVLHLALAAAVADPRARRLPRRHGPVLPRGRQPHARPAARAHGPAPRPPPPP